MCKESLYLHTLHTEVYDAAVAAAKTNLAESDLKTRARLEQLARENGAVADAAAQLLTELEPERAELYLEDR